MERQIGVGVIGLGWMGRVHTSSYRRVIEHFPDLGVRPRLVIAADVGEERRTHAERVGFEATSDDWRAVLDHPDVEVVSITLPNAMHREVALATIAAGKHVWVEKPVGRGVEDTAAVAEAARRAGVVTGVGFCYRFAPAVQHARELIRSGAIGDVTHYRGVFLADYANRPDAAASWRFFRQDAGSGALGDLMAHVVDMTHFLVGPIDRLNGRTATMIAQRPQLPVGEGTHFSRVETGELVDVENEDWAGALFELGDGTVGSLEASRVIVGPRVQMRFEVHGTRGALSWELERMNELERFQLSDDGADEGYTTVLVGPQHGDFAAFQPGAGVPMGYDDLRVTEARAFLEAVRDGEQREPGVDDMLACARVLEAIERSSASGAWEPAR
ncbi:MAG TPA: Gfo/Idh/MocA family oxidoreductase [Solirubrobacteraceae bacterium]